MTKPTRKKASETVTALSNTKKPATKAQTNNSQTKKPRATKAKTTKSTSTTKPKAAAVSEVDKLKSQLRQLRKDLKASKADNEILQQEVESLSKKNANLTRQRTAAKSRVKSVSKKKASDDQSWVDKWWERF